MFIATQELIIPYSCIVHRDLKESGFAVRFTGGGDRKNAKTLESFVIIRTIMLQLCACVRACVHYLTSVCASITANVVFTEIADVSVTTLAKCKEKPLPPEKLLGRLIERTIINDELGMTWN
jgi:hypothetical protein